MPNCGSGLPPHDPAAFEALVERHGRTVLSVCRGVLSDPNDAEDVFQATFLVLLGKARSTWAVKGSLGSWLYRVAYHTAIEANRSTARRRAVERRAMEMATSESLGRGPGDDIVPVLHEEIGRLPEKYRARHPVSSRVDDALRGGPPARVDRGNGAGPRHESAGTFAEPPVAARAGGFGRHDRGGAF